MTETTGVKGKGLAIAGMVVGIVAFILSFFSIGLTLGVIGLVLAAIGFAQLNKTNGPKGMAITGIALGALAIAISIVQYYRIKNAIEESGVDFQNLMEDVRNNMEEELENN